MRKGRLRAAFSIFGRTGQARAFALPMLATIVIATVTARLIEWLPSVRAARRLAIDERAQRIAPRRRRQDGRLLRPG
jgi:hypothetical protein